MSDTYSAFLERPYRLGRLPRLSQAALVGIALAGGTAGSYLIVQGGLERIIVCAVAGASLALLFVPLNALPPLALALTLMVPTGALPLPDLVRGVPLGIFPFAIWLARRDVPPTRMNAGRLLAAALVLWLLAAEAFAQVRSPLGLLWLATALVTVALPAATGTGGVDVIRFRRFFMNLTAALAAYAIVEAFVLQANPIYGELYKHTTWLDQDQFSVYRAETLMGHPLVNSTVFAAAVALAFGDAVSVPKLTWWSVARLVLLVLGLAATVSRSGAVAAGVAVAVVLILGKTPHRGSLRKSALILVTAAAAVVLATSTLARGESAEGRLSAAAREKVPALTVQALEGTSIFGAGPGESENYRIERQLPGTEMALENSYAQLAVSLGPIGAALFAAVLLTAAFKGFRRHAAVPEAGALVAMLVAVASFNALEQQVSLLVVIGLLVASISSAQPRSLDR